MSLSTDYVDATHEEASNASNLAWIAALRHEILNACEIGLNNFFIDLLREQQRDVDVDALCR